MRIYGIIGEYGIEQISGQFKVVRHTVFKRDTPEAYDKYHDMGFYGTVEAAIVGLKKYALMDPELNQDITELNHLNDLLLKIDSDIKKWFSSHEEEILLIERERLGVRVKEEKIVQDKIDK